MAQRDRHVGGLSAVSDLQPLHHTRHAALPGLFAEQGSLQFLVAHAAGDAGARIIPVRRQASGMLTGQPAQAVCEKVSIQIFCQQNVTNGSTLAFLNDIYVRFQMTYMSDIKLRSGRYSITCEV